MQNENENTDSLEITDSSLKSRTKSKATKENVLKLLGSDIDSITEYLNEKINAITIEKAPSDAAVKEGLYHIPREVEYLGIEIVEVEMEIKNKELDIHLKKEELKMKRAEQRKQIFDEYMNESKNYMPLIQKRIEEFKEIFDGKTPPAPIIQEIIRNHKPDKPTNTYLDDLAMIKTAAEEKEIVGLEVELLHYKKMHMLLKLVEAKFIDKKFANMKMASLIEAELRSFLS